mmetsp:Transcript_23185/g.64056  ORF Transcript_23185/g.64056 Transcript_23185/m.64056 type:complete len:84 (-) Transcript_23185:74-325(-)
MAPSIPVLVIFPARPQAMLQGGWKHHTLWTVPACSADMKHQHTLSQRRTGACSTMLSLASVCQRSTNASAAHMALLLHQHTFS